MRTLSIGADLPFVTASHRWTDDYNLKDYRATFANLRDIESAENIMTPESTPSVAIRFPSRRDVLQYCKNGNDLFVILPAEREIDLQHVTDEGHQGTKEVDLLDWLPFRVTLDVDPGESVVWDSVIEGWSWYFSEPFQREYVIKRVGEYPREEASAGQLLQDMLIRAHPHAIPLAETISGDSIGVAVDLTPVQQAFAKQKDGKPGAWGGRVYLLPLGPSTSVVTLVKGILRHVFGQDIGGSDDRPEWVTNAMLEYESEILDSLQQERQRLQEVRHFKELWWATGERLEDRVVEALQRFGLSVSDTTEDGLWDGLAEHDGTVYVLEVTGSESEIGINKTRQLQDWVSRVADERPTDDVSGLLVGNPHRVLHPYNRGDPLTEAAVKHLDRNGNLFLDTGDLLGAVLAYLRKEESADAILEKLFDGLSLPSVDSETE